MNKYLTLTLFDWDDTLFPTTWLIQNNIDLLDKVMQNKYIVMFSRLDNLLHRLLLSFSNNAKIIIVTNATSKWIDIALDMLPNTKQLIKKKRIPIISARDHYQDKYPNNIDMWKQLMFKTITSNYFKSHKLQNIISIGDAEYEFKALVDLYNEHAVVKNKLLKTVKFVKEPTFELLIDQLEVLGKCHFKIINDKKHMDLQFNLNNLRARRSSSVSS
jgi:hypothetical protein